jgi:hypothetical protein
MQFTTIRLIGTNTSIMDITGIVDSTNITSTAVDIMVGTAATTAKMATSTDPGPVARRKPRANDADGETQNASSDVCFRGQS